jgi:hypothetical protein
VSVGVLGEVAELTGQIRDLGTRICPDMRVTDLAGSPVRFRCAVRGLILGVAGRMLVPTARR